MAAISGFYIALTALLLLALSFVVIKQRRKYKVGLLDGGQKNISVAMRAHANAIESAVPTLLLLLVAELNAAPAWLLHLCGFSFLLSRVLHAYGFIKSGGMIHAGRFYGTLLNWLVMLALVVYALFYFAMSINAQ